MSFLKHLCSKKKSSFYTVMIVPGKYGSSKSLVIPKWLIGGLILLSLGLFAYMFIIINNYSAIKKQDARKIEDMKALKMQNMTQQKELNSYEEIEMELNNKLEELKKIESQLKTRLGSMVDTEETKIDTPATNRHVDLPEVDKQIKFLYSLISSYDTRISEGKRIPSVLPCSGSITSYFGGRANPVSRGRRETHHGIDIANSYRTQIKASADGIVEYAGWLSGYGYAVIINHQNGYTSLYGHNSKLLVKKNQRVKRGQTLSLMGSTGRSTGTHVHFEVRLNGNPINPLKIAKGGKL